jgi:hypothetical protein
MDDRLIRELTAWLMKSGWVRDYEHARAEAEGFANWFASVPRVLDASYPRIVVKPWAPPTSTSGTSAAPYCAICAGWHIPGAGPCTATYSSVKTIAEVV